MPAYKHTAPPTFPIVELQLDDTNNPTLATSNAVTSALCNSGFLIVKTSLLSLEMQHNALASTSQFFRMPSSSIISHPIDPKEYAMIEGTDSLFEDESINPTIVKDLQDWYKALRQTKNVLLQCVAVGLSMDDPYFFVKLHDEDNDALRLIKYHPGDINTCNRCKEHSD